VLTVDVAHTSQIKDAFAKATETFGRIDVVLNNAAIFQSGEAEARKLFDANF
jgi:NAD(P)-dependent dehydrogenase (short-subunit alcohol dehydrogenase family)